MIPSSSPFPAHRPFTDAPADNALQAPETLSQMEGIDLSSLGGHGGLAYHHESISGGQYPTTTSFNSTFSAEQPQDARANLLPDGSGSSSSPRLTPQSSPRAGGAAAAPPPYDGYYAGDIRASSPEGPEKRRGCGGGLRWHSSWNMYASFLFGLACAIGHHAFYNSLDGRPADNQLQMLRYGTVLAFVAKAGLGAAAITAFRQRVWTTVSSRVLSIAAVDSLFAAADELAALLNWEFISQAKTAAALAAFVWLAPLVVILTSNTLLVEPRTVVNQASCGGVRTLNFTFEETNDWRNPTIIDGLYEVPLSTWNTTKPDDQDPPGWFDYYTAPGPTFEQMATLSAFLEEVVPQKNASMDVCGAGWNCTFSINFTAPGYKCTELASGVGAHPANLTQQSGSIAPPFGMDILVPRGPYTYYAFTSGGEYSTTQMKDAGIGGIPTSPPPYPKHLGAFRTEPVIWIGYITLAPGANAQQPPPDNTSDPRWNTSFVPKMFACEHYETAYTASFNYSDGAQTATVTNRTFLAPVVNTTFLPGVQANDGTGDNTTASPEANYVYPAPDVARYRRTAAYHSMGLALREFINGTVELGGGNDDGPQTLSNPIANTEALQTKLLDPRSNYLPFPNLADLVQGLYEDVILSLLSHPQFVEVVWAAAPGKQSGALAKAATSASGKDKDTNGGYPCTRTRTANMYSYHARDLWIVYGIAVLLSLAAVASGALAVHLDNGGVVRDTRFSSVVAATRGPALDGVRWMAEDDGVHGKVTDEARRLRVGYGSLLPGREGGGVGRPGSSGRRSASIDDDEALWKPGGGGGEGTGTGTGIVHKHGFGLEGDVKQVRRRRAPFRFRRRRQR